MYVTKEKYQEVESKLMMAESEIRELKFSITDARKKVKEAMTLLDFIDTKIKL